MSQRDAYGVPINPNRSYGEQYGANAMNEGEGFLESRGQGYAENMSTEGKVQRQGQGMENIADPNTEGQRFGSDSRDDDMGVGSNLRRQGKGMENIADPQTESQRFGSGSRDDDLGIGSNVQRQGKGMENITDNMESQRYGSGLRDDDTGIGGNVQRQGKGMENITDPNTESQRYGSDSRDDDMYGIGVGGGDRHHIPGDIDTTSARQESDDLYGQDSTTGLLQQQKGTQKQAPEQQQEGDSMLGNLMGKASEAFGNKNLDEQGLENPDRSQVYRDQD